MFTCRLARYLHHPISSIIISSSPHIPLSLLNHWPVNALSNPLFIRPICCIHTKMSSNSNQSDKKQVSSSISSAVSSRVHLSILGNGSNANPVSLAITTDRETMLINCGEAVQRLIFEHKVRIGKIRNMLFTNVRHENFAGFFGFLLTIAPTVTESNPNFFIYGPSKMRSISKLYDDFMYHARNIHLSYRSVDRLQDNEDEEDTNEESNDIESLNGKTLLDDVDMCLKSIPIYNSQALSQTSDLSVAYLFSLKDKPGQLLVQKCKELKLPPGPLFAKLKSGQEIEFDGRVIKPIDVLGPSEVGPAFVVLECPTDGHIDSLTRNGTFSSHFCGKSLEMIVHITPSEIFNDGRYQGWLKQFDKSTKHILLNRDNQSELSLVSSSISQVKLNMVSNEIFTLLNESQVEQFQPEGDEASVIRNCPTLLTYQLRPTKDIGISFNPDFCRITGSEIVREAIENSEFVKQLEQYRDFVQKQTQHESVTNGSNEFKRNILFLGTGSATPGKLRNTSAILVNLEQDKSMLWDCGEATFLQLNRFYGKDSIPLILRSLKAVFISHIHADHHFGLIRIIQERAKLCSEPLLVIAPEWIGEFLQNFSSQVVDLMRHIEFIDCGSLLYDKELMEEDSIVDQANQTEMKHRILNALSLKDLVTVRVPHCFDSHGIVVTTGSGEKIAYSGDTMYSNAFDEAGRDCLLMIHEATMNDDLWEEARDKRHSTMSQAIQVGTNCNARFTVLTHFSQRYAKIAPVALVENQSLSTYIENNVGIAFDFMHIELDQLWKIAKLKPALETLFAEDIQDMADIQTKKALKRKLADEMIRKNN